MPLRVCACAAALAGVLTSGVAAQSGGKPVTGNPTPGTEQPAPPNLADRITLTGCVEVAKAELVVDGNTVTDAKFQLTGAEPMNRIPPDTGGSALASSPSSRTYRLAAIESQLSPYVGAKVEISGEILPRSAASQTTTPTIQVEFVQKLSATCR